MVLSRFQLLLACVLMGVFVADAQMAPPGSVEYETDFIPSSVYKARRDSLMKAVGDDAVVLLYSAPVRNRNNDVDYVYRQDDNFTYMTGFPEPHAFLLLAPKGISVKDPKDTTQNITVKHLMFVQRRDPLHERWEGRMYGPEGAMEIRGIEYATLHESLERTVQRSMFGGTKYFYMPPIKSDVTGELARLLAPIRSMTERFNTFVELRDPTPIIFRMRAIKDAEEIRLLRKATEISAMGHVEAMKSVEPGMYEYEVQAVYDHVFTRLGAEAPGYPHIVGSGENTCILHYNTNRKQIKDGELILADCGAEYHGYSSDVTRTYPANGKFTKEQRQIYDIVLAAQEAAIAVLKPGARWSDASAASAKVIEDGLHALGLVKEKDGREFRKFYWHGLGHSVGLNVHDVSSQVMQPGVVYTVEPGIYIQAGIEGVPPAYYNIGVRIEDVILITPGGNENLSAYAPRKAEDVERVMRQKGIGNQKLR